MSKLDDALDEQIKALNKLSQEMAQARKVLGGEPTLLDFRSVCQTINHLLERQNQTPLSDDILRQWGVTGSESMKEIYALVDEWINHVKQRGKDET